MFYDLDCRILEFLPSVSCWSIIESAAGCHCFDMSTLGACSVHQRDTMSTSRKIMSTSGDVQYIGGYHDTCGEYHEYIRGCSVNLGDTMSTLEGYYEYIRRIS